MNIRKSLTIFAAGLLISTNTFGMVPHKTLSAQEVITKANQIAMLFGISSQAEKATFLNEINDMLGNRNSIDEDEAKYKISRIINIICKGKDFTTTAAIIENTFESNLEKNHQQDEEQLAIDKACAESIESVELKQEAKRREQEELDAALALSLQESHPFQPNALQPISNSQRSHQSQPLSTNYVFKAVLNNLVHKAASEGNLDYIKPIVESGKLPNLEVKNLETLTLLHCAIIGGQLSVAKYLVSKGAQVECCDHEGNTSLHGAAMRGMLDITKYLVEECNANINAVDTEKGFTPLHYACEKNNKELAEYLIDKDADTSIKDKNGHSPEYYAQQTGNNALANLFKGQAVSLTEQAYESAKEAMENDETDDECPVCLEDIPEDNRDIASPECGHFICKDCKKDIKESEKNENKCPLCRGPLS